MHEEWMMVPGTYSWNACYFSSAFMKCHFSRWWTAYGEGYQPCMPPLCLDHQLQYSVEFVTQQPFSHTG